MKVGFLTMLRYPLAICHAGCVALIAQRIALLHAFPTRLHRGGDIAQHFDEPRRGLELRVSSSSSMVGESQQSPSQQRLDLRRPSLATRYGHGMRHAMRKAAKELEPKPAAYHARRTADHAARAARDVAHTALSLPVCAASGLAGGLVTSSVCAVRSACIRHDARRTLAHLRNVLVRPAIGIYGGLIMTTDALGGAIMNSARVAYHGSTLPIAKAYEALAGPPSPERQRAYESKVRRYSMTHEIDDLDLKLVRNGLARALLGESYEACGPFFQRAGSSTVHPVDS